ncbi:ATP-binding protein [Actinomadura rupiterrae]|uniref:ATP-binding protein n=1 Tax=Actinomadura rupiterrae TaxID=559627 RepID=UPI0020A4447A|nr:ATP-binding protein [Actinomadura rupiterrae]MCP2343564.1 anti-sigma regulatory factor (Ser/Thr protein kinase) [Actinomadura rupiterrae]
MLHKIAEIDVPGAESIVGRVRRHLADKLAELLGEDSEIAAETVLLADELIANAIRHTRSGEQGLVRVSVCLLEGRVLRVSVRDEGHDTNRPRLGEASLDDVSGRGLMMVDQISTRWGVIANAEQAGSTVWFERALGMP